MIKLVIIAVASALCGAAIGALVGRIVTKRKKNKAAKAEGKMRGKIGVMDKVLIVEAIVLILYTIAALAIFWHTGQEPAVLTGAVFGVCGMENGFMGWIKTNKDSLKADTEKAEEEEEPPAEG